MVPVEQAVPGLRPTGRKQTPASAAGKQDPGG